MTEMWKSSSSLLILLILCFFGQPAHAGCPLFSDVITHGSYGLADNQGHVLASCNIDTPFIPASIIKIPTALVAFQVLGGGYRFKTELYSDFEHNLYIRGFGDPLLISEEVLLIGEICKQQGLTEIRDIFIDDSVFDLQYQPPGRGTSSNPYDAPIGATVVNFNTVSIRVDKTHNVHSAEPQTPTVPIMKEIGKVRRTGRYQVNICQKSCDLEERMARYTAELFRAQLKKIGIKGKGRFGRKSVPDTARLLHVHFSSKTLEEVLTSMLKYSSNFIANLVYLTIGAEKYGYPATWEKANRAVHDSLVWQLGPATASLIIQEEGSGLSRNNMITGRVMLKVLQQFKPHADMLPMRRRVRTKSGTMKGVYNYAGYLRDGNPYVVLLNQEANTRSTVLDRLKQGRYPKESLEKKL